MRDYNDEWDVTQPTARQFYTVGGCKVCKQFTRVYLAEDFLPDQRGQICAECLKPHGWVYDPRTLELVKVEGDNIANE